MKPARPFLKWVGGKAGLLPLIAPHLPAFDGDYHEPFVGGGALFFHLRAAGRIRRATLCDANERLIRTYRGVRDTPEMVLAHLEAYAGGHLEHPAESFADARRMDIDGATDAEVAAWFIYINRTGYNGLYRTNRAGRCNTPFGKVDRFEYDADNLRACSAALRGVDLRIEDFGGCRRARRGDLVFFDPPYVPVSKTSAFVGYTPGGFSIDEHARVRDVSRALKARGVHVLLWNSAAPVVRDLFADGFDIAVLEARRNVNCKASRRGTVGEVLIS